MKEYKAINSRYIIPLNTTKEDLLGALKPIFNLTETEGLSEKVSILDSFEWGFYQNKMMAFRHENNSITFWEEEKLFKADNAIVLKNKNPKARFWWDFDEIPDNLPLKKILRLRAMQTFATGSVKIEDLNFQDENGKTVVFCQLTSFASATTAQDVCMQQVELTSVMGYEDQFALVEKLISQMGCFKPTLSPMDSLLRAFGVTPTPYDVKPELSIEPAVPARSAVNSIVKIMLEKQRLTEAGVIDDIDTEFLHHFRVSVRMIRAAIAQLKEVYPAQDVVMLKDRFGKIGRETNHLRDLDVFILDKERYLQLLPASLRDGLLPMFGDFEEDRETEVKRVAKWLSGNAYKKEMADIEAMFQNGFSACETQWSEKPAIELAVNKLGKCYKKIQKAALKISNDTPDDAIHSIRIDCKKLRYLLYFFGSMFDKKRIKLAGKQLKKLQDKLGIFNDLTVQGEYLERYLDQIEHKKEKNINLIAALGGLIATLHSMQRMERDNCIYELMVFSNQENQQLFTKTFEI